jgi:hypothetical protein
MIALPDEREKRVIVMAVVITGTLHIIRKKRASGHSMTGT